MTLNRILVATDFSSHAERAGIVATGWAKRLDAELHWVHGVEHLPASTPPSAAPLIASYVEQARHRGKEQLATAVEAARAQGLRSEGHMVDAPAARGVVELARKLGADCVVVGSRGHGALQKLLLGSVASRIVHDAPCRVLAVRGEHSPVEPGTIVLGDDLSELSNRARADALELARRLGASLDVVHAPDLGIPYFTSLGTPLPPPVFEAVREEAAQKLDALIENAGDDLEITRSVVRDKPAHAICERAEHTGAGLVVVGTGSPSDIERLLLGSVADRVVQHAPCSVLVVR